MSESERREVAARREWAAAQQAYQMRVDLAIQLAQIEVARIEREENAARKMVLAAEAQKELYTDLSAAQDELDEKRAQAEQKRTEELQRQVDEIQKVSTGLFHTLFTKPGDFPEATRQHHPGCHAEAHRGRPGRNGGRRAAPADLRPGRHRQYPGRRVWRPQAGSGYDHRR